MTEELPRLIRHLLGFYAIETLAMGRASGALAALGESAGTLEDLARRSGLDEHNLDLWLRAMTTAGHAQHEDGVFSMTEETRMLLSPEFPVDMGSVLDFVHAALAEPLRRATAAMATGAGVPAEAYAELGAASGAINTRIYQMALVDEWIAAAPGLPERLASGGRIADLACGNGDAAALMAATYPSAEVVGLDPGAPEGAHAGVANLQIVRSRAAELERGYDLVTCLDAFHHLGESRATARRVHDSLREGGVFLVAETALSGDVDADSADPLALIAQAAGLMYCLQENLANGGEGSTPAIGLAWVDEALSGAGFESITHLDSETGYRVFLAMR